MIKKFESFHTVDEKMIKDLFVDLSDEFKVTIRDCDDGRFEVEIYIGDQSVKGKDLNKIDIDIKNSKKISIILEQLKQIISRLSQIDKMEFRYYLEQCSFYDEYKIVFEMSFNEDYKLYNPDAGDDLDEEFPGLNG